jgi:NAD(P)-dependent dehydrogenase (short-subunit alcohol dehydrogenase family)
MPGEFEGRHVVITGGTGALGTAVVTALLDHGAHCHVPVFRGEELQQFPHTNHERVRVETGVDLTDEGQAVAFYAGCPELWASLQIAGGFAMAPIADTAVGDLRRLFELNVVSCFLCCREATKRIRASGSQGRIVNVSARPAVVPTPGMAAYAASKSAVAALTQSLAEELSDEGIWVNAVLPSIIDTPANRAAMPNADHEKWPKPDQIAATLVHLASPANAVGRGALVPVFGRS